MLTPAGVHGQHEQLATAENLTMHAVHFDGVFYQNPPNQRNTFYIESLPDVTGDFRILKNCRQTFVWT
jgi:hypothetical protein